MIFCLKDRLIADELLQKIQAIHNQGFLPSITPGDPGVGDTLEHALGIERNNSRAPDYKGIELKTTRLTRNGVSRQVTRSTLFTKVPDVGMTYREIVDHYGKIQEVLPLLDFSSTKLLGYQGQTHTTLFLKLTKTTTNYSCSIKRPN